MKETSKSEFTFKIKPQDSWLKIGFKELWQYREVFYLLVWRDLKVRYKQTMLGVFWAILQPLIATIIFTIIFTRFARFETGDIPYSLFALTGFTFWMFINSAVAQASNSLIHHEQLVTKIYFPRIIVPSSFVGASFLDLLLTLLILFSGVLFYGIYPTWKIIFIPLFLIHALLISLSFSLFLSAFSVRFRDVKFVVPFLLQIWMFASPVFYPSGWIPERLQPLFALNPVTGLLDGFRHIVFGTELNLFNFGLSLTVTIILSFVSLLVFRKMEDDFADLL
jgi:lipopolysaccharide transport system permease protein